MPIEEKLAQLEQIVRQHQHAGHDFTSPLRNLDWQQLGKLELVAASTSMSLSIPVKKFLRILIQVGAKSGSSDDYLRFNSDSGANYTFINSGGAARTSQSQIDLRDGLNSALGFFAVIDIVNYLPTIVKSVIVHTTNRITAASTAQTFYEIFGTWVNTALPITSVSLTSSGAATYPVGSSILVLGNKE